MTTEPGADPGQQSAHDSSRPGLSVRARIAGTVAFLVTAALLGAGIVVYMVESSRVLDSVQNEVEQELEEFKKLQEGGVDPVTGQPLVDIDRLLTVFMQRNVPDDDEMLVGWIGDESVVRFPAEPEALIEDPEFRDTAMRLVETGGTETLDTEWGEVRVTSQPLRQGDQRGALLVLAFLDEDINELNATMRTYSVVALFFVVIVGAAAYWRSGRLLRPLRVLQTTTEEINDTDLSRRIPETGNDDITALTRTVNGMLDRLEHAFVGQRQFLDDVGHELRTPLTVIGGHLELLDSDDPAEVEATRELVLDEVDRMSRLVRDLILLAKTSRPDFINREPVQVTDLTVDVLAKVRALGDRRWELDGTADVVVDADGQRLTQALLQLCDNAVKHTRPGDTIGIGSTYRDGPDGQLVMWVRDTGRGIPSERQEDLFERFARASVPIGDEGFGLGLSIVRAIARAHGGEATLENVLPHGLRVVLTLPVAGPPTSTSTSTPTPEPGRPAGPADDPEEHSAWPAS